MRPFSRCPKKINSRVILIDISIYPALKRKINLKICLQTRTRQHWCIVFRTNRRTWGPRGCHHSRAMFFKRSRSLTSLTKSRIEMVSWSSTLLTTIPRKISVSKRRHRKWRLGPNSSRRHWLPPRSLISWPRSISCSFLPAIDPSVRSRNLPLSTTLRIAMTPKSLPLQPLYPQIWAAKWAKKRVIFKKRKNQPRHPRKVVLPKVISTLCETPDWIHPLVLSSPCSSTLLSP